MGIPAKAPTMGGIGSSSSPDYRCVAVTYIIMEEIMTDIKAELLELLRLFKEDFLSAEEAMEGILQDTAALRTQPICMNCKDPVEPEDVRVFCGTCREMGCK